MQRLAGAGFHASTATIISSITSISITSIISIINTTSSTITWTYTRLTTISTTSTGTTTSTIPPIAPTSTVVLLPVRGDRDLLLLERIFAMTVTLLGFPVVLFPVGFSFRKAIFRSMSVRRRSGSRSWLDMSEIDAIVSDTQIMVTIMYTIAVQILTRIRASGRGSVFTPKQFLDIGSRAAVDQTLSRLVRRGVLQRVGRGLYHYPKRSSRLGDLAPTPDAVARAYARKTGSTLQVSGAQAANALGLSSQVPARATFVTNGATRQLRVGSQVVFLRRAAPRRLVGAGTPWGSALQALAYLGQGGVDAGVIRQLKRALSADDRRALGSHAGSAPDWMRPVIGHLSGKP